MTRRICSVILLLSLCLMLLPSCGADPVPADAILAYAEGEHSELFYFYGIAQQGDSYYVRVLREFAETPDEGAYLYVPLREDVSALFQPDGWLGAWSPYAYDSAEALHEADQAGKITHGVKFSCFILDGSAEYLAEYDAYTDIPIDITTGLYQDDYDLPTSEVPELLPDVLSLREKTYDKIPRIFSELELTEYALWNFLWGRTEFECYLTRELAPDEGQGYAVLSRACENTAAYFLFSAYEEFDMYTKDIGDPQDVYARVKLNFVSPEDDLEARAEALEFVLKNPVPEGGFTDFWEERDYARKIHDYLACKVTYSAIGYQPHEEKFGLDRYTTKQEAFTCLGEDQHETVCAGYARAFALIAHYAGINVAWVWGNETPESSHAWNILYPCDGSEAVLIDVTWDDTESFDEPGQTQVSDRWFYHPLTGDTEHTPHVEMTALLNYLNLVEIPVG